MSNSEYIAEVLDKLSNNPTAQDLDYLIEAHARVGYLAATARGRAEQAEATKKYHRATAYADARASGRAKSATDADNIALIETRDYETAEIRARETATKISNLLGSIEQSINGIKYLGRQTDVVLPSTRR
jgi:hypothetical protein